VIWYALPAPAQLHCFPDYVHVLAGRRHCAVKVKELALELEAKGYDWLKNRTADCN